MSTATTTSTGAGRLRLMARLQLARHGVDLLHSKEEALQRERTRLEGHVSRTNRQWVQTCGDAAGWLLRCRALGASGELEAIMERGPDPATVTAHWQTSMGVTYPGAIDCEVGSDPVVHSTAALRPTIDAYALALRAGAEHASTTAALRRLDRELADTRRRRRAIEQRLVPRLEVALRDLDLSLDERDREEALRVHIATNQQRTPRR